MVVSELNPRAGACPRQPKGRVTYNRTGRLRQGSSRSRRLHPGSGARAGSRQLVEELPSQELGEHKVAIPCLTRGDLHRKHLRGWSEEKNAAHGDAGPWNELAAAKASQNRY